MENKPCTCSPHEQGRMWGESSEQGENVGGEEFWGRKVLNVIACPPGPVIEAGVRGFPQDTLQVGSVAGVLQGCGQVEGSGMADISL